MEKLENQEQNNFRLRPIKDFANYNFFVDDYQRGYKWTAKEALDLLNDIHEFSINQGIYCLQPLVVKERKSEEERIQHIFPNRQNIFELIDGQQRITTIYMILTCLESKENLYSIAYRTREASEEFLNSINSLFIPDLSRNLLDDIDDLQNEIIQHWENYLNLGDATKYDNVDNFHFFLVYQTICLWFKGFSKSDRVIFLDKLANHTQVIWYEVEIGIESEKVFSDLNSGKIDLTNAELIKALFINQNRDDINKELGKHRQLEIAQEWDTIEYSLQKDDFWYFINSEPEKNRRPTRIDFLFELIKGKPKKETDLTFTYRQYDKDLRHGKQLDWQEVKLLYQTLMDWFNDRELYHLIGFCISRGIFGIEKLNSWHVGLSKSKFKELVHLKISDWLNKEKDNDRVFDLNNLNYGENSDENIISILLLFNIDAYLKSDSNFRFPFDRFKKEEWNLEHIHAQKAALFITHAEIRDWAEDLLVLLKDLQFSSPKPIRKITSLEGKLREYLTEDFQEEEISKEERADLIELSGELNEYLEPNSILNLALLDGSTNRSIGNRKFILKRKEILEIDKKGWVEVDGKKQKAFIPLCTKNVFLKYYSSTTNIQMTYWGQSDRNGYREALEKVLQEYSNPIKSH
jgi:uncharacterized protein with ParB-like and HNH nuclease domain